VATILIILPRINSPVHQKIFISKIWGQNTTFGGSFDPLTLRFPHPWSQINAGLLQQARVVRVPTIHYIVRSIRHNYPPTYVLSWIIACFLANQVDINAEN